MSMIKNTVKHILHNLLPGRCVWCKAQSQSHCDLCASCENDLPFMHHSCQRCAAPLPSYSLVCAECQCNPPLYHQLFSVFSYETPIDKFIIDFKFQKNLKRAKLLSYFMIDALKNRWYQDKPLPEIIIPIPLHTKRLRERGFNQSIELAKPIVKRFKTLQLNIHALQRIKNTAPQSDLPAIERHKNIKGAFELVSPLSASHIALVDDVVTTGDTINEAVKVLKKSGIEKIDVWCCARAKFKKL